MAATLPKEMQATNVASYELTLEPDLSDFRFTGVVTISIQTQGPLERLLFHASELEIRDAKITSDDSNGQTTWKLLDDELLAVETGSSIEGSAVLRIEFEGELNDRLAGFYRSELGHDGEEARTASKTGAGAAGTASRYCAVTQFEENEARKAFPCIDHPSKKAVFSIELIAPEGSVAVANTPVEAVNELDDGRTSYRFEKTPVMSTYLLFFGVGPFEIEEDHTWRVPIRIVSAPGKTKFGARSISYAREALSFCEDYTGIDYPIAKMDLIGVPDFAYGAMENYGAITFRENYLYEYPGITSDADLERIALIIAHEVAHMWFGNLVSPVDWSYIWLNESFATYFGHLIVEKNHPEWENLKQFIAGSYGGAMDRDALLETIPIEFPEGGFTDVDPSTAPIIYSKAGAILHMMRDFLGEESFGKGVHAFLSGFSFDCAHTDDFLSRFGSGSGAAASEILTAWIRRAGFPAIRPIIDVPNNGSAENPKLRLTQQRFTWLPGSDGGSGGKEYDEEPRPVPVAYHAFTGRGKIETGRVLMTEPTHSIELPPDTQCVKLNAGQAGFYRVEYPESMLPGLGEMYKSGALEELDRYGLLSDLHASVRKLDLELGSFLGFLDTYLEGERAELPVSVACGVCDDALLFLPGHRDRVTRSVEKIILPVIDEIGLEPGRKERSAVRRMRTKVLQTLLIAGNSRVTDYLTDQFRRLRDGAGTSPDLRGLVIRAGAATAGSPSVGTAGGGQAKAGAPSGEAGNEADVYEWFVERLENPDVPEVTIHQLLAGLGWFGHGKTLSRALEYVGSKVPVRNRVRTVAAAASNPAATGPLRSWIESHIDELATIHPYHFASILAASIPAVWIGRETEAAALFDEKKYSRAAATIRMLLERLRIRTRYLSRYRKG